MLHHRHLFTVLHNWSVMTGYINSANAGIRNGPDSFTVVPTSDLSHNIPFHQWKCTNQIGVVANMMNYFIKCNTFTSVPHLDTNTCTRYYR